jgi:hypothetical protein
MNLVLRNTSAQHGILGPLRVHADAIGQAVLLFDTLHHLSRGMSEKTLTKPTLRLLLADLSKIPDMAVGVVEDRGDTFTAAPLERFQSDLSEQITGLWP